MAEDQYAPVNAAWPQPLPPITRDEATRAARLLMNHFVQRRPGRTWIRRCWISPRPTSDINRGWGRLVHDVSHRAFEQTHPHTRPHGGGHARMEQQMVEHVLAKGWLTGTLRPAPKVAAPLTMDQRLGRAEAAIKRWESKRKRAETALRKLRRRVRRYRRQPVIA